MKMVFSKIFTICTCKDPNLAEKFTNFMENEGEKLNSIEFVEFVYSKSSASPLEI